MICSLNDCSRKIKLTEQTTCKCNKCCLHFCSSHRLSETHNCSFDYKSKSNEYISNYVEKNKCVNSTVVKI